jgi:hypothetical protein
VSGLAGSDGGIVLELRPAMLGVPTAGVFGCDAEGTLVLGEASMPVPEVCAKAKAGRVIKTAEAAKVMDFIECSLGFI